MCPVTHERAGVTRLSRSFAQRVLQDGERTRRADHRFDADQGYRGQVRDTETETPHPLPPERDADKDRDKTEDDETNVSRVEDHNRVGEERPDHHRVIIYRRVFAVACAGEAKAAIEAGNLPGTAFPPIAGSVRNASTSMIQALRTDIDQRRDRGKIEMRP